MDLKGKKISVLGMGISGIYSSVLLVKAGADVLLSDTKKKEELGKLPAGLPAGIRTEFGGHSRQVLDSDAVVISPGIPSGIPILKEVAAKGIPVIGEIELAFLFISSPIIAITGSNGKTTTTVLTGEMLKAGGKKVIVGGNIGEPLTKFAGPVYTGAQPEAVVAEISSFQLETIKDFRPKIAALLNINANHLDRYPGMEEYIKAKARIFENQHADDFAVINGDCPATAALVEEGIKARKVVFSRKSEPQTGVFVRGGKIISRIGTEQTVCEISQIKLIGQHNLENALAATAMAMVFGIHADAASKALREFTGLEHRMEPAGDKKGVRYINDSKGTTVDAVLKALESLGTPGKKSLVLIAGGRYKGGDFGILGKPAEEKAKKIILIGEAKDAIEKMLLGYSNSLRGIIMKAADMGEAVRAAAESAEPGDEVVLSPGCSSFDMFRDYKERGRIFKDEVSKL